MTKEKKKKEEEKKKKKRRRTLTQKQHPAIVKYGGGRINIRAALLL